MCPNAFLPGKAWNLSMSKHDCEATKNTKKWNIEARDAENCGSKNSPLVWEMKLPANLTLTMSNFPKVFPLQLQIRNSTLLLLLRLQPGQKWHKNAAKGPCTVGNYRFLSRVQNAAFFAPFCIDFVPFFLELKLNLIEKFQFSNVCLRHYKRGFSARLSSVCTTH